METEKISHQEYSRDISPNRFLQALQKLAIPTTEASITFTLPHSDERTTPAQRQTDRAYVEWHRESSFTLDNTRRFSTNERTQPIKTITELGIPTVTVDVYEKRSDAGRGMDEFNKEMAPALSEAGYEPVTATIELTNRRFLGLTKATVVFEDNRADVQFNKFAGKKFREQTLSWLNTLPTNPDKK